MNVAVSVTVTLAYARPANDQLTLSGHIGSDSIVARFKRLDERRFLLLSRGFNWIQEQPFNR